MAPSSAPKVDTHTLTLQVALPEESAICVVSMKVGIKSGKFMSCKNKKKKKWISQIVFCLCVSFFTSYTTRYLEL